MELERLSHSLKGAAGNVGASVLSVLAAEVCQAVRDEVGAAVLDRHVAGLREAMAVFQVNLASRLGPAGKELA